MRHATTTLVQRPLENTYTKIAQISFATTIAGMGNGHRRQVSKAPYCSRTQQMIDLLLFLDIIHLSII